MLALRGVGRGHLVHHDQVVYPTPRCRGLQYYQGLLLRRFFCFKIHIAYAIEGSFLLGLVLPRPVRSMRSQYNLLRLKALVRACLYPLSLYTKHLLPTKQGVGGQHGQELLGNLLHTQGRHGGIALGKHFHHKIKHTAGSIEAVFQKDTSHKRGIKALLHLLANAQGL